jgi:hypothetical protein
MNRIVGSFGSLTRTVTPATYTVSGTVTVSGVALSGVTITSVALGNTTTDGSGNYSYTLVPIGTAYTITPTKTGYTFSAAATGTVTGTTTANSLRHSTPTQFQAPSLLAPWRFRVSR